MIHGQIEIELGAQTQRRDRGLRASNGWKLLTSGEKQGRRSGEPSARREPAARLGAAVAGFPGSRQAVEWRWRGL